MRDPLELLYEKLLYQAPGSFRARKWAVATYAAWFGFSAGLLLGVSQ